MISSRLALRLAGLQGNSSLRAGNPDKAHRAASGPPLLRLQTLFDSLRLVDSGKC